MNKPPRALLTVLVSLSLFVSACERQTTKDKSGVTKTAEVSPTAPKANIRNLLTYLPQEAVLVGMYNSSTPAYQGVLKVTAGYQILKDSLGLESNKEVTATETPFKKEVFSTESLFPSTSDPKGLHGTVFAVSGDVTKPDLLQSSSFILAGEGSDLTSRFLKIFESLKDSKKITLSDLQSINGATIAKKISGKIESKNKEEEVPLDLYLVANDNFLLLSKDEASALSTFAKKLNESATENVKTPIPAILNDNEAEISEVVSGEKNIFFLDGKAFGSKVKISSGFDEVVFSSINLNINKEELQKNVPMFNFSDLNPGTSGEPFKFAHSQSIFSLGIDSSLISFIKTLSEIGLNFVKLDSKKEELATIKDDILGILQDSSSLTLNLLPNNAGMPIPDIAFLLQTKSGQSGKVSELLERVISGAAKNGGSPFSDFMSQEFEGVKTRVLNSPLGVGAFVAPNGSDELIIGSTQNAFVQSVKLANDKGKLGTLPTTYSSKQSEYLNSGKGYLGFSLDFNLLATALKQGQQAVGLFTGGKSMVKTSYLTALSKLGNMSGVIDGKGEDFSLKIIQAPPKEPLKEATNG
jgi:hypothetical protein